MATSECLSALHICRSRHYSTRHPKEPDLQGSFVNLTIDDMPSEPKDVTEPWNVAAKFSRQAAKVLNGKEMQALCEFLRNTKAKPPKEELEKGLNKTIEVFKEKEAQLSAQSPEGIKPPEGPLDADLGLILHLRSEDENHLSFWNAPSATMDLLQDKGFNAETVLGFDWHWRADERFRGKPGCPADTWHKGVKALHDDMSCDTLDALPLPFLVTGSWCTREAYRKRFEKKTKGFNVKLDEGYGTVRFDLEFCSSGLRRLVTHTHHPVAGFFFGQRIKEQMANQLDGGLNFMMWLTGRQYQPHSFHTSYQPSAGYFGCFNQKSAPLLEMWSLLAEEKSQPQLLKLEDYPSAFIRWAGRYLCQNPYALLAKGESLVEKAAERVSAKMSIAAEKRFRIKGKFCSESDFRKTFGLPSKQSGKISGAEREHDILIDEVAIPIPSDVNFDDEDMHMPDEYTFKWARNDEDTWIQSVHGCDVQILKSGRIKIVGSKLPAVRIGDGETRRLMDINETLKFHFVFEKHIIELRSINGTVYNRAMESLLYCKDASRWIVQLKYELDSPNCPTEAGKSTAQKLGTINVSPHDNQQGGHSWRNRVLQRNLLDGFNPHSKQQLDSKHRVNFQGLHIHVPATADPATIHVQCFFLDKDSPNRCVVNFQDDDPAAQLGVFVKYRNEKTESDEAIWWKWRGELTTKKVNSLVDLLNGKSREFTSNQGRRFLLSAIGKWPRNSYTS